MRLTIESFALQGSRLIRVLNYLGTHLDEDVTLPRLADMACLSVSQLERLYCSKTGETPMATLRRLRLKRALAQIRAGQTSLIDAGLAANYGSQAAFTRAFVRQFGYAPSRLPLLVSRPEDAPRLRLETLPAREVFQQSYGGQYRERYNGRGYLDGSLAVSGAKKWRTWTQLDRDNPLTTQHDASIDIKYFIPASDQPYDVRGVDRVVQAGGLYAVHEAQASQQPSHLCGLAEQIRYDLSCQLADGPILLREITVSSYRVPQERRTALYIPVAPLRTR